MINRQIWRRATLAAALSAIAAMAACGGGGGDGPSTPQSVNVAAFAHNRLHTAGKWTLNGTATTGGTSAAVQLAVSATPGAAGTFALTGAAGGTTTESITVTGPGGSQTTTQLIYFDATDHPFGSQSNDGTCSIVSSSSVPLPTTAAVGASGALLTSSNYDTCSPPVPVTATSTTAVTWSVEAEAGIVFVCENSTQTVGSSTLVEHDCLESDANGTIGSRARVVASDGSTSITARSY